MDDTTKPESEVDASVGQAGRARLLRAQADWYVDMAAKVADPRLFRAYVEAAMARRQQALDLEGGSSPEKMP